MEQRNHDDDTKIITALICLFIGFMLVWNITAHVSDTYELQLDAGTCNRVKTLGLAVPADCIVNAPFRQVGPATPAGILVLPDGSEIQISPLAAKQINGSIEWPTPMKVQFGVALLFWVATLVLLLGVFRGSK